MQKDSKDQTPANTKRRGDQEARPGPLNDPLLDRNSMCKQQESRKNRHVGSAERRNRNQGEYDHKRAPDPDQQSRQPGKGEFRWQPHLQHERGEERRNRLDDAKVLQQPRGNRNRNDHANQFPIDFKRLQCLAIEGGANCHHAAPSSLEPSE
ncbi:hypothetical protein [Mesorhizobium sp. M0601]|uniref:hypothetical protein n=1 Tax=Mesorhizobium sp. M0601 TaxID=2956969 RepID=UPI003336202D